MSWAAAVARSESVPVVMCDAEKVMAEAWAWGVTVRDA